MAKSKKYYVVWKGVQTGIFDNWEECKRNVEGVQGGSVYKSFPTLQEAELAFSQDPELYIKKRQSAMKPILDALYGSPITPSIAVDGAYSSASRQAEYQGVYTETGTLLFKQGPFLDGTNNVMEFLAIVHALAWCKQNQNNMPIYSDSRNAIKWVKDKKAATKMKKTARNERLFELIARAEHWLKENTYSNQLLKWETQTWGEIPADFGRK